LKLRLRGNSLRLRLDRREIGMLAAGETVRETLSFGVESSLTYAIAAREQRVALAARFDGLRIDVLIRADEAERLAHTDAVGIEAEQAIDGGGSLSILVEKDFACLAPRDDDSAEAYENPRAQSLQPGK
jgi:hypothetical protein